MTKQRLARVQWKIPLVQTDELGNPVSVGAGWELVNNIKQLSEELKEAENALNSDELQGTDFENFSSQEDKLKVGISYTYVFSFSQLHLFNKCALCPERVLNPRLPVH